MAGDYCQQYDALVSEIQRSRPQRALELFNDLAKLANDAGDDEGAEQAVISQLQLANELGNFQVEFQAFNQLESWYAAGRSNLRGPVLWFYKWIGEDLHNFPSLSRKVIGEFFGRMEKCFRQENEGLRPVYGLRMKEAAFAGHEAEADAWRAKWEAEPSAGSDDCPACETHGLVESLLNLGRPEQAIEAAAPILSGEQYCGEVPATTFSRLLLPLMRASDERCEMCHMVTLRAVRVQPKLVRYLADHVIYLCLTDRSGFASRLVAVMLARVDNSPNGFERYRAAVAAWLWGVARKAMGESHTRVPRRLSWAPADQMVSLDDFIARHRNEAMLLAGQFDARNGSSVFAERLQSMEAITLFVSTQAKRAADPGGTET